MHSNCVELSLDALHLPPRLVVPSLRCIIRTLIMLRVPQEGEDDLSVLRCHSESKLRGHVPPEISLCPTSHRDLEEEMKHSCTPPYGVPSVVAAYPCSVRGEFQVDGVCGHVRSAEDAGKNHATCTAPASSQANDTPRDKLEVGSLRHTGALFSATSVPPPYFIPNFAAANCSRECSSSVKCPHPVSLLPREESGFAPRRYLEQEDSNMGEGVLGNPLGIAKCPDVGADAESCIRGKIGENDRWGCNSRHKFRVLSSRSSPMSIHYLRFPDVPTPIDSLETKLREFTSKLNIYRCCLFGDSSKHPSNISV